MAKATELFRVTLDERQIREACEIAVRDRVSPDLASQAFSATILLLPGSPDKCRIDVVITKKRERKAKAAAAA